MSFREVGINIASMGKYRNVLFSVCLAPLFLIAASSSASAANAGGSCSKANVVSGTVLKPLVCKKVNGKLKWVLAPGGSCQSLGTISGTVSKPWVCQRIAGKLRWVELNQSSTTTTTTASKPISVPAVIPNTTNTSIALNTNNQIKVTTTTIACPTGSYVNNVGSLTQTVATFPATEPGYTWYPYMRYIGSFTNNTNSNLLVSGVARIGFSPPFTYGVLSPQDIGLLVNSGSEVPPGATVLVSGYFSAPSAVVPSVVSASVRVMWNTAPLVAFCPAPAGS
jgi:hypothetical protein